MFNWIRRRIQENYQKHTKNNKNYEDSGTFVLGAAPTRLKDNDDFSSDSSFDSDGD